MRSKNSLALAVALLGAGCVTPRSYAEIVHRDEGGGTVALEGPDRAEARLDADRVMREQCGGAYRITAEDRVLTGHRTTSLGDSMVGYPGAYPGYPLGYPPGYELGYPPGYELGYGPGYPGYVGNPLDVAPGAGFGTSRVDTETQPIYERRLTYRCEPGGAAVPPPGAPPAPSAAPPAPPSAPPPPPTATPDATR